MMLSDKKNVLQVVALVKAHGIKHVVLSPGSRNSPLTHTFVAEGSFICHNVVDERSAAFYAIGVIQATNEPVAICCTSGSAVLNYAPAVSEAFYQQLPLLVITADRPTSWIGQMAGQTMPQLGAYNAMVKKSVQLPEINSDEDEWFCNRLVNEAIIALNHNGRGPVQINVPISEPLFNYTTPSLPNIRKISLAQRKEFHDSSYQQRFSRFEKKMIIVGQLPANNNLADSLEKLAKEHGCVILAEHLANVQSDSFIGNFDVILKELNEDDKTLHTPDLLITLGGHVVSKRIKEFVRQFSPTEHWHISESGDVVDLYQHLTDVIDVEPQSFVEYLSKTKISNNTSIEFSSIWTASLAKIEKKERAYSEHLAVEKLLHNLPQNSSLQLANSLSVRYAQQTPLKKGVKVFCNRGTSGIEGCVSTAVGYASINKNLTFLVIGDLAFFYDMNGLWNRQLNNRLRILLLNNGRGDIFYSLPGLNKSEAIGEITAKHQTSAEQWAKSVGFEYLSVNNEQDLDKSITSLTKVESDSPILVEVFS